VPDLIEALAYAAENHLTLSLHRAAVQDLARGREQPVSDWVVQCHQRAVANLDEEPLQ
jgi:hypothetical protein